MLEIDSCSRVFQDLTKARFSAFKCNKYRKREKQKEVFKAISEWYEIRPTCGEQRDNLLVKSGPCCYGGYTVWCLARDRRPGIVVTAVTTSLTC